MPIPVPRPLPNLRPDECLEQVRTTSQERHDALTCYQQLDALLPQAQRTAPHDWIAFECLANHKLYAKPDAQKRFVLWEASTFGTIEITLARDAAARHPWIVQLFHPNGSTVRFPFNTGDTSELQSLSWKSAPFIRKRGGSSTSCPGGAPHRVARCAWCLSISISSRCSMDGQAQSAAVRWSCVETTR